MRARRAQGATVADIVEEFGVGYRTASRRTKDVKR